MPVKCKHVKIGYGILKIAFIHATILFKLNLTGNKIIREGYEKHTKTRSDFIRGYRIIRL